MRRLLRFLMMLSAVLGLGACQQKTNAQSTDVKEIRTVGVDEFEKTIASQQDVVLLDVRTSEEYAQGHLDGALLIDFKGKNFQTECTKQIPSGKTVAVYCRSGFRSNSAGKILAENGYTVINLKGGITAWQEAGKPVVK